VAASRRLLSIPGGHHRQRASGRIDIWAGIERPVQRAGQPDRQGLRIAIAE
jgi:hypothetical protein